MPGSSTRAKRPGSPRNRGSGSIRSASAGAARFPSPRKTNLETGYWCRRSFASTKSCCGRWRRPGSGEYFHASDSEGLAQVYAAIDTLEKTKLEETKYSEYTELFRWFAVPGLAVILLVGFLMETRFRSLPLGRPESGDGMATSGMAVLDLAAGRGLAGAVTLFPSPAAPGGRGVRGPGDVVADPARRIHGPDSG